MCMYENTIVGVATMVGNSGINIVRISGKNALFILNQIFEGKKKKEVTGLEDHQMIYGHLVRDGQKMDEVMAVYMKAPRSYTAEDVVEIHLHGGMMSVKVAMELAHEYGAETAQRGEFTKRAFLNGRLDLSQAEAIMGVIGARTEKALQLSVNQLEGKLSKVIQESQQALKKLLAKIEVYIDYPEEDLDVGYEEIKTSIQETKAHLEELFEKSKRGKLYMQGLQIAFLGRTNVGKSSLMNALLKEEKAIVTDIPGTTRDVVEAYLHIGDIPIKLVDTAGVRESEDLVEQIGIQKTLQKVEEAQLVIGVLDSSQKLSQEDMDLLERIGDKKHLFVLNKSDLKRELQREELEKCYPGSILVETSAFCQKDIDNLEQAIKEMFLEDVETEGEVLLYQERHLGVLKRALSHIEEAQKGMELQMPFDCIEVDLYDAYTALGEITGMTVKEDIVDLIFSEFCVGK